MTDVREQPNYQADFDGSDYQRELDHPRLSTQLGRIWRLMSDHQWRTIFEIAEVTGDPHQSILAQLGHLRKRKFGAYAVDKRVRGRREDGLWEYRVGERGSHVPRRNPLRERAEFAEEMASILAEALELCDPENPVLLAYRETVMERS